MKISLQKANKIRSLLESEINSRSRPVINRYVTVMDKMDITQINTLISEKVLETNKSLAASEVIISALFNLRLLIQEANYGQINGVINQIAETNALIKYSPAPQSSGYGGIVKLSDLAFIEPKGVQINIDFSTKSMVDEAVAHINDLKKQLRDLEEKRNELNHQTLVDLPDILVEVFKELKYL